MSIGFTSHETDQQILGAGLARIRARLQRAVGEAGNDRQDVTVEKADQEWEALAAELPGSPLGRIIAGLGLTLFETDLLLLCAGVELDPEIARCVARLRGPGEAAEATFAIALACLDVPHWNALSPGRPLRYWKCLTLEGRSPTRASLSIDERTLTALLGLSDLDRRLLERSDTPDLMQTVLPLSHMSVARQLARSLRKGGRQGALEGPHRADRQRIAAQLASDDKRTLCRMMADAIPSDPAERSLVQRLWERESLFQPLLLLLELDLENPAPGLRFAETCRCPIVISSRRRVATGFASHVVLTPTPAEQETLWRNALGAQANGNLTELPQVLGQFDLSAHDIQTLAQGAQKGLWARCRRLSEPRLAALAERIESEVCWDNLVLPEREGETLQQLVAQVRNRFKVYHTWGMAEPGARGRGVTALFAGPSGTGKTLAAEVIANELALDLYRIDLSAVVSKYIGETEKNLARIFDAAEGGGVILLFDEADALFGERSQVTDSHDRYANIEIAYLLQRMEAFGGLSILTTNIRDAIDHAFLRRLRYLVDFPFPDRGLRQTIWARSFPATVESKGLDFTRLARLNVPGGTIRTIALNAAFLAADQDCPLGMEHIRRAAGYEYDKMGRLLSPVELEGWS